MPAYILTWNPNKWPWSDRLEDAERVRSGAADDLRWSAGGTRSIPIGSRVYLLRQGEEPRGIMASGWTTSVVYPDTHWDAEKQAQRIEAYYVDWQADVLLDLEGLPPLDVRLLPPGPAGQANWVPYASGTSISDDAATQLESIWASYVEGETGAAPPDQELSALEGEERWRLARHRSRERALRTAKLSDAQATAQDGRVRCEVPGCGFDFEAVYGPLGRGFAHVHHLRPLAEARTPVRTTLADLAVVCANCHAMIHVGGKSRGLQTLIQFPAPKA